VVVVEVVVVYHGRVSRESRKEGQPGWSLNTYVKGRVTEITALILMSFVNKFFISRSGCQFLF
jgi:hypothetical protein